MFVPESLRRQNELVRTLKEQLEATERELANQKWVFDQFLQSPSWKITRPLRWLARTLRKLRAALLGTPGRGPAETPEAVHETAAETVLASASEDGGTVDVSSELKRLYSSLYRTGLETFLASNAVLELPTREDPVISIILILFNRAELTLECLRSIRENFLESFEVIIVDNASSDETRAMLERVRGARVILNAENRHFLLAMNQAAREARGEYLLFLNNDAQLMPGAIRAVRETLESSDDIGAVGGRIILLDGSLQEAGSIIWRDGSCLGYGRGDNPISPSYVFRRDVDYCSAALLITRRKIWEALGGFDEAFKPAYYEETDYCARLWEHGFRVVYEPSAIVLHYEFASSRSDNAATALQAEHQQIFADRHAEALQRHFKPDPAAALEARSHGKPRRILFIDDRVPHPWLGSGFPRARTILLALHKQGFFVTFYPMAVLNEGWATVYSDVPREIEVMNELGPQLLEAFLRHRQGYYDAILISRPHNMAFLQPILVNHPEWFETTEIIYDAEAVFATRDIGLRRLGGELLSEEQVRKIYQDEVSLALAADCVTAVSEMDFEAFRSHGMDRVFILGHSLECRPTPASFADRSGFLFVGAVHDEASPNGDSVLWFLQEIWPNIVAAAGPEVQMTIAGLNRSDRIRALASPSVIITGHLDDLTDLYNRARVLVAPTRFAAGIPHKVHEAAARGLPVVATPLLARQLGWKDGVEISVAQTPESFAAMCLELHENERVWNQRRRLALEAVQRECSQQAFEERLHRILSLGGKRQAGKRYVDA